MRTEAERLAYGRKIGKRERAWMVRHASTCELHTSEDYPRKLEALGLVIRRPDGGLLGHEHVLTPTPLFEAVIQVWAREAAGLISAAAAAALAARLPGEPIVEALDDAEILLLSNMEAIHWNGPPWRSVGRWERTGFGYQIRRAAVWRAQQIRDGNIGNVIPEEQAKLLAYADAVLGGAA